MASSSLAIQSMAQQSRYLGEVQKQISGSLSWQPANSEEQSNSIWFPRCRACDICTCYASLDSGFWTPLSQMRWGGGVVASASQRHPRWRELWPKDWTLRLPSGENMLHGHDTAWELQEARRKFWKERRQYQKEVTIYNTWYEIFFQSNPNAVLR